MSSQPRHSAASERRANTNRMTKPLRRQPAFTFVVMKCKVFISKGAELKAAPRRCVRGRKRERQVNAPGLLEAVLGLTGLHNNPREQTHPRASLLKEALKKGNAS